ncbi:uncharacterized protein KY384_005854 [Bacidia gigantensis]|uniref:uncharacterized protein n=1 Tax=Bacidia gigantensis TaxID=2732470 RepID=UPI001D045C36|nr:uncharacterized protein KY384_005854 [Bacidia gigantensis]KAG8529219.1 hypothetical protein KY384_005854 [Bacidia gigantensis]
MAADRIDPRIERKSEPARIPEPSGAPIPEVRPQNANTLPGGGLHTAGGKIEQPSISDALKSVKISDFKEIHKKPCVREALMIGIGGGFGVGGLRAIFGGEQGDISVICLRLIDLASVMTSCNWAVGTFCFGSFLMHEYCQRKRALEKGGMKRAVEVMEKKQTEKRVQSAAARAADVKSKREI